MGFLIEQHPERADLDDLIQAAQASPDNDTAAMCEIVRRFEPLALRLARSATDSQHLHDDLASEARIALIESVRRHNPAIRGFAGFAKTYMLGAVRRTYHRWLPPEPPAEAPTIKLGDSLEPNEEFETAVHDELAPWGDGIVEATVIELKPAQQRIATMRYIEDAPLVDIARVTGTGTSAVSQRLSTIHRAVEEALAA